MQPRFSRREIVLGGAAASVVVSSPGRLLAQAGPDPLRGAIAEAIDAGGALRANIVAAPVPLPLGGIERFVVEDANQRYRLAEAFAKAAPDEPSSYVLAGFRQAYSFQRAHGMPAAAAPRYIVPMSPAVQPPPGAKPHEPVWIILVDIMIDALGLGIDHDIFMAFLKSDPELQKTFEQLAKACTTRDWQTVAKLIDELLKMIFLGETIYKLASVVAEKLGEQAARRLLRRSAFALAVRFVPYTGWIYAAACLALAIKANWHRFA